MATNGTLGSSITQGAGLAIGASLALGGIALANHLLWRTIHIGLPHEFILAPRRIWPWRHHWKHHHMSMNATMNTLGPGPDGRYHLY